MMIVLILAAVTGCIALCALCLVFRRIGSAGRSLPVTAEWIDELSMERYRPMARLLDSSDIEFLRSQPGFTTGMLNRLRAQRCEIFRGYLRCLNSDFGRVCAAIRLIMMQSGRDRPDLAAILVRNQVSFATGMLVVYFRLALYRLGVCGVDVTTLVQAFDSMRLQLRQLVPATAAGVA